MRIILLAPFAAKYDHVTGSCQWDLRESCEYHPGARLLRNRYSFSMSLTPLSVGTEVNGRPSR